MKPRHGFIMTTLAGLGLLEIINGWAPSFPRAWVLLLAGLCVWASVAGIRQLIRRLTGPQRPPYRSLTAAAALQEGDRNQAAQPGQPENHHKGHHYHAASQTSPTGPQFEITPDDPEGIWMKDWRGKP